MFNLAHSDIIGITVAISTERGETGRGRDREGKGERKREREGECVRENEREGE